MSLLQKPQEAPERERNLSAQWATQMKEYAAHHSKSSEYHHRAMYLRFTRIPQLEAELAEAKRFLSQHGHSTPGWDLGDLAPLD